MKRALIIASLLLVTVTGCRRGPSKDTLAKDLQARLEAGFSEGLFSIHDLSRRGHYPYTTEGDDRSHLLVYWDAELAFARDYKLSDWDQLNVGSLISVLGATALGVEGVNPDGNISGDLLAVHGTSAWVRQEDGWAAAVYEASGNGKAKMAPMDKRDLPYRQHLERLGEIGAKVQRKRKRLEQLDTLTAELEKVVDAAELRLARSEGKIIVATGAPPGEYSRQGAQFVKVLNDAKHAARDHRTSGSMENCELVSKREVTIAYSQNDVASMAFAGTHLFEGQIPQKGLRALASLYPEAVQVVTLKSSGIKTIAELRENRIDIGPQGSGSRISAIAVLEAADIGLADLSEVQGKESRQAAKDLAEGKVDAIFLTNTFPTQVVTDLANDNDIALVPFNAELIHAMQEQLPHFLELTVPARAYRGVDQPVKTVGVTAMLVTHAKTPAETIQMILADLYGSLETIAKDSPQGYLISKSTAKAGVSIPMHPAATAFFAGQ